ncbi:hypothetical protein MNBD_PLANCTO02-1953 [hydrothermal vent metagenome]|uniref:Pyrrolo-quinoline quinone repeat domain-containing protein n=1 Tax=hydrothermal vent metagenome TaxID=652676 RepID=A0A3B1D5U8_9ZZZZ
MFHKSTSHKSTSFVLLLFVFLLTSQTLFSKGNWARWRGPNQDGHTTDATLPEKWSDKNVLWKQKLPGIGQSSPCIWGDKIYLTAALERGRKRLVLCLSRKTGKIIWQKEAWQGVPEPTHRMNGWASSTCVTDGKRVYAFFGRAGGLYCYSAQGELLWNKKLGNFDSPWGTAACPVLVDDLVIQNCDSDNGAYIVAFDKKTGKQKWRTRRDDRRGWSTPVLLDVNGHQELVLNGDTGVKAYNPQTGKELWFCKSFTGRGTPTVTLAKSGLLMVVNGKPGDCYAIRPGGKGNVTKTNRLWHTKRRGRDLSSPVCIQEQVLIVNMKGILSSYQTKTGKILDSIRVGGNYSATPIACNGKAYFINEAGETSVVQPGKTLKVLFKNKLTSENDEIFRASITPHQGKLFIRSTKVLYCIGKAK